MDKYYKETNLNHNIYSSNNVINNLKYYGDLIESRYDKSRELIFGKKNNDKKYSDMVISKDNIEFFTVEENNNIIIMSLIIVILIFIKYYVY